jgi:hypothetical protein
MGAGSSCNDDFKKGATSMDAAARKKSRARVSLGLSFPQPTHGGRHHRGGDHILPQNAACQPPQHPHGHGPSKYQNHGHACQPTWFPPSRATARHPRSCPGRALVSTLTHPTTPMKKTGTRRSRRMKHITDTGLRAAGESRPVAPPHGASRWHPAQGPPSYGLVPVPISQEGALRAMEGSWPVRPA